MSFPKISFRSAFTIFVVPPQIIIAGSLGISAGRSKAKGMVIGTVVMSIIAGFLSLIGMSLSFLLASGGAVAGILVI